MLERLWELERLVNRVVWGPGAMGLILGAGLVVSALCGFPQVFRAGTALRVTARRLLKGKSGPGAVSPFQALCTALAASLGTGNIAGVAGAIAAGGPGAVFWMWVSALVGMGTKYVEVVLALRFRKRDGQGQWVGGPMYYIAEGLGRPWRWLAGAFALFGALAAFGLGNLVQVNTIAGTAGAALTALFPRLEGREALIALLTGLLCALVLTLVLFGGAKRVGEVCALLVPALALLYAGASLVVIFARREDLPEVFSAIFRGAFRPQAVVGGAAGITIRHAIVSGVGRGIFSNEAGLGASGITAAAADTEDYIKQGCISMTGVFLDTVVVCTITGLAFAASGVLGTVDANGKPLTGTALTLAAFRTALGDLGGSFISVCIALFAFATVIGWAYQGEKAFEFLMGGRTKYNLWYRFFYGLAAFLGCICSLETVWNFSDICNALMAVPNLICVLALSGKACKEIREYPVPGERRARGSRNP